MHTLDSRVVMRKTTSYRPNATKLCLCVCRTLAHTCICIHSFFFLFQKMFCQQKHFLKGTELDPVKFMLLKNILIIKEYSLHMNSRDRSIQHLCIIIRQMYLIIINTDIFLLANFNLILMCYCVKSFAH